MERLAHEEPDAIVHTTENSMPSSDAAKVAELRRLLEHHDYRYHVLDDPEVEDAVYDALYDELKALEDAHPDLVTDDSPTQRVGGAPPRVTEGRHLLPISSLEKVTTAEALEKWGHDVHKRLGTDSRSPGDRAEDRRIGDLARLRAGSVGARGPRGDGERGEDVSRNLRTIDAVPLRVRVDDGEGRPSSSRCGVRSTSPSPGSPGSTRRGWRRGRRRREPAEHGRRVPPQLDPRVTADRPLSLWVYGFGAREETFPDQWEMLRWLRDTGSADPHAERLGTIEEVAGRSRVGGAPRRSRLRDRRDRDQGRRPRPAAPPRRSARAAALGARLTSRLRRPP